MNIHLTVSTDVCLWYSKVVTYGIHHPSPLNLKCMARSFSWILAYVGFVELSIV